MDSRSYYDITRQLLVAALLLWLLDIAIRRISVSSALLSSWATWLARYLAARGQSKQNRSSVDDSLNRLQQRKRRTSAFYGESDSVEKSKARTFPEFETTDSRVTMNKESDVEPEVSRRVGYIRIEGRTGYFLLDQSVADGQKTRKSIDESERKNMSGISYGIVWFVLIVLPLLTAWKRKWWAFGLYAVGLLVFVYSVLQDRGEWDDLADFATLVVVVGPIYLIATLVWIVQVLWGQRRRK